MLKIQLRNNLSELINCAKETLKHNLQYSTIINFVISIKEAPASPTNGSLQMHLFCNLTWFTHRCTDEGQVRREIGLQREREAVDSQGSVIRELDLRCDLREVRAQVQRALHVFVHQPLRTQRHAEKTRD